MTFQPTVVLLALQLGAVPALAQGDGGFQRWPSREREATTAPARQGDQGARPREREQTRTAEPATPPPSVVRPAPQVQREAPAAQRDRQDRNRDGNNQGNRSGNRDANRDRDGGRDRGNVRDRDDNGRQRVAVPRQGPPPRVAQRPAPNVYVVRPPAYRYTPRFNRPYTYGSRGPGYFYYGSYGWYPRATYLYDRGYFGRGYASDFGEVRLRVEPRGAEVYVDGYFAGTVDDFDGTFQSLKLEAGPYHIEIVAPGYDTLEVDLRVSPGQKITYRGDMRREF